MSQTKTNNQQPNNQANKQAEVLGKLQRLQEQRQSQKSNLTRFDGLVVVNVGVKPTEHFPKLKDSEGNKVKDENGKDKRSDVSDGWTYTFAEFGTAKVVKVVILNSMSWNSCSRTRSVAMVTIFVTLEWSSSIARRAKPLLSQGHKCPGHLCPGQP